MTRHIFVTTVCWLGWAGIVYPQQAHEETTNIPFLVENSQSCTTRKIRNTIFNSDTTWSVLDEPVVPKGTPPPPPPGTIVTPLPLPELPVEYSDAVVVGEVRRLQPYLTADKKAIYTEYAIKVDEVIKPPTGKVINGEVTVLRRGGIARLGNGCIVKCDVTGEGAPLAAGQQYLFFLKYREDAQSFLVLRMWFVKGEFLKAAYPNDQERAKGFQSNTDGKTLAQVIGELKSRAQKP